MSEPYTQSYGPRSKRLDVLVSMLKISRMGKIWEDFMRTVYEYIRFSSFHAILYIV